MGAGAMVNVRPLTFQTPAPAPNAPLVRAAAPSPPAPSPAPSPGFWESASTGEKVVIVGAGLGAVLLLFLAFKK